MNFRAIAAGLAGGIAVMCSANAAEVCTAVADAATGQVLVQRGDCQRQVTPASTFKIAISLMGYDAGFLQDERQPTLPFREGYVDWRASWREPAGPARWMSESVVWYSQQVTRSLGGQRFADYVRKFQYGNADVSGDAEHDGLTLSWISSSLRISPLEQLSFLTRVVNRQFDISAHAYDMTARLTAFGRPPAGWRVNGKTGAGSGYGWYVGWATKGARTFVFAHLMQRDKTQPQEVSAGVLARDALLAELPALLAAPADQAKIGGEVDKAIQPLMRKNDIAGMAVALSVDGAHYFYNYGVASKDTGQPVSSATLFEIGSLSKTFTATLATYAQANGQLSMSDKVSQHLPYLRGSSFDNISLIHLGTHTAGDFPLQVPAGIADTSQLMDYYKQWQPAHAAGTHRTYSNPGIGLLGVVTATRMGLPFAEAMEKKLFPALGMAHSYINVPAEQMPLYAQGYNAANAPVRVNPGLLADEAYGVKSNTADLIRFVSANMGLLELDARLARALADTHIGYFRAGEVTQGVIWEQYAGESALARLLKGNSMAMIYDINPATAIDPPLPPQADVWINKTGSTGGFGAYALYNPARKIGIVMLANRSYSNDQRVAAAYQILAGLDRLGLSSRAGRDTLLLP